MGSRNKLSEAFLDALRTDFQAHGAEVIERVRLEEPAAYLQTVASVMPKKVEVDAGDDLSHLTDAQLCALIHQVADRDGIDTVEHSPSAPASSAASMARSFLFDASTVSNVAAIAASIDACSWRFASIRARVFAMQMSALARYLGRIVGTAFLDRPDRDGRRAACSQAHVRDGLSRT